MVYSKIPCNEQDLYAVSEAAISNFRSHMATFAQFKAKYDNDFATALETALADAKSLRGVKARGDESATKLVELRETCIEACDTWQDLKSYIVEAFPNGTQTVKLNAAGWAYYNDARSGNVSALRSLLDSGLDFIKANKAALMANKNMPENFEQTFSDLKDDIEVCHTELTLARANKSLEATTKKSRNQVLYRKIQTMLADGRCIFRKDDDKKLLFTFDNLLSKVGRNERKVTVKENTTPTPAPLSGTEG